jgi:hypothetical protein
MFVTTYLYLSLFPGLLNFNSGDLLLFAFLRFDSKRESPGVTFISEFRYFDEINITIVIEVKIVDTSRFIDLLFEVFGVFRFFRQFEYRLQIKTVGSLL